MRDVYQDHLSQLAIMADEAIDALHTERKRESLLLERWIRLIPDECYASVTQIKIEMKRELNKLRELEWER